MSDNKWVPGRCSTCGAATGNNYQRECDACIDKAIASDMEDET